MLQISEQLDRMSHQLDLIMDQALITNKELQHQGVQLDSILNTVEQTDKDISVATSSLSLKSKRSIKKVATITLVGASIGVIVLSPVGIVPGLIAGTGLGLITGLSFFLSK
jgi:hypothetical protein